MSRKIKSSSKKLIPYNYIWSKENPMSYTTEMYQKFLANFEVVNIDKKYKVIQVTSSVSSEGKSTFISNISYLLAKKGLKVILIDLDLRKPKVHRICDIENQNGVSDVLTEKISLEKAIKKNKSLGFDAITSGEKTSVITNLLQSKKIFNLINDLKSKYDYILIDSPPVINVSDALYISKLTDAVVFIVSQEGAKKSFSLEAVKLLRLNKVNIIGAVMTQVNLSNSSYGYNYYSYKYYDEDN